MVGDGSEEAKEIGGRADGAAEEGGRSHASMPLIAKRKPQDQVKGQTTCFIA